MTQPASDLTQPTTDTPPATRQQSAGNILVVDDTASNPQFLTDVLIGHGYDMRVAPDGSTALMLAQAEPPDLIMLNIRMTGMDGYEVCRQLKSQSTTRHIPLIFISARDEMVDKVKGFESGGVDYITKPFQAEEVLARVKTHLTLYKLQKELVLRNEALQQEIAERIQTQKATSYERDLVQVLLRNTTDYIYFKDRDRRFVRASNSFCNLLKRNLEEIIGKRDEELFPAEFAQETTNDDRHVIETGTPLINREEGALIGGEERWVLTTKLPWYDKDGNIVGLFGISREITERKRVQDALQESEEKFRGLAERSPSMTLIIQPDGGIVFVNQRCVEVLGYTKEEFYASDFDFRRLVAPEHLDFINDILPRRLGGEDVPAYEYALVSREGQRIEVLSSAVLIHYGGKPAILKAITDITERKQMEEELRRRIEETTTLHTITQLMTTTTDLPATLNVVAETITYLFDAENAFVAVPAVEDTQLQILARFWKKTISNIETPLTYPLTEIPEIQQVLNLGQNIVWSNVQSRTISSRIRTYVEELDLQTIMLIPLIVGGNVLGVLGVGARQPGRAFGTDEVVLAETIAADIAETVKNVQLTAHAQSIAVDAERQRLARELHDSVTQSLYSLTLLSSGWGTMATQGRLNQQQVVDSFKQLGDVGQQALKEMRLLIHQLRLPVLEEVGLVGALQQRLDAVEKRVNIETHLHTRNADELPLEVAEQLWGIALEALNNILRHARATEVTINLQVDDDNVRLSVQDNGVGFDPNAPSLGLGLTTMHERAQTIHANLQVTSAPQQGTTVEVTCALESNDND